MKFATICTKPFMVFLMCGHFIGIQNCAFAVDGLTEGVIEGQLVWDGQPIEGAQVMYCNGPNGPTTATNLCGDVVAVRTDSSGSFRLKQYMGPVPPVDEYGRVPANSAWLYMTTVYGYGFRVEVGDESGLMQYGGFGVAPIGVSVHCDFGVYVRKLRAMGIPPGGDLKKLPLMDCDRKENRSGKRQSE